LPVTGADQGLTSMIKDATGMHATTGCDPAEWKQTAQRPDARVD